MKKTIKIAIGIYTIVLTLMHIAPKIIDLRTLMPQTDNETRYFYNIERVIIHHDDIKDNKPRVRSIADYQLKKWGSVSYHYYIAKNGRIFYLNDISRITPHTRGQNSKSIGVCLAGDLTTHEPTTSQYISLNYLLFKIGIGNVSYHRDHGDTTCPGMVDRNKIYIKKLQKLWNK